MKQSLFGLMLLAFLALPPVSHLLESIMIIHMHMQMPLLVISGYLMARFFQLQFPAFFDKWNSDGLPGITLFVIISIYWMIPRTMDDAINIQSVELFKFVSLPFLAGVPLRDSWVKLKPTGKTIIFISFIIMFIGMGLLYIFSPVQLCNSYVLIEQITLGWGFVTMAICMIIYMLYTYFVNPEDYE